MFKLLIVDEDQQLRTPACAFLERQGYKCTVASNATEALDLLHAGRYDLMLCSMSLPVIDGPALVHTIRKTNADLPIILISHTTDYSSKLRAFNAECDDFMAKPVDLNELVLRITALLRRSQAASKRQLVIGDAVLDSDSLTVVEGSASTVLPPKEFMTLFKLCSSPGRIFSRREIMDDVWGVYAESGERTVDVHIKRLRKRFMGSTSFAIETVRGVGYKAVVL